MKAALFALAVIAAPALAHAGYEQQGQIGEFGIREPGALSHPLQAAEGPGGLLYVADYGNKRVQVFEDGAYARGWGSSGTGEGQFHEPGGLAVHSGRAYVSDRDLDRVQAFDLSGGFLFEWGETGSGEGQLRNPGPVAVSPGGTVYVADYGNARVQAFSPDGQFLRSMGSSGTGDGQFVGISDVAAGRDGYVYAADRLGSKIVKFGPDGSHQGTMRPASPGWEFSPVSVAPAPDGSLFVLNSADGRLVHLQQEQDGYLSVSERRGPLGGFGSGADLALSGSGALYVVDMMGHRVLKFSTPYSGHYFLHDAPRVFDAAGDWHCPMPPSAYNIIVGTPAGDVIEGTGSADAIFALGGDDAVSGHGGDDCLLGGPGDDLVFAGPGDDAVYGGEGDDRLFGFSGDDRLWGGEGLDEADGGGGADECVAEAASGCGDSG